MRPALVTLISALVLTSGIRAHASERCPEEQQTPQVPTNFALCQALEPVVRHPRELPLHEYQAKLGEYLQNLCHRDLSKGWKVDKHVRDTGPYVASYENGKWSSKYIGTHAPVLVWYSPEMYSWLKINRAGHDAPAQVEPVPDGAMIIKEMYTPPAAACSDLPWQRLRPTTQGAAVMVRDSAASQDGWFWGWVGWNDWQPDWPNRAAARAYPFSGFGQYCINCHASAANNQTFAALNNIKGEPGEPLVYLIQNFFLNSSWQTLRERVTESVKNDPPLKKQVFDPAFTSTFSTPGGPPPRASIVNMPSETYDNVWAKAGPPTLASQYVTSDQCVGCHSAGGTGLHFDMTEPSPGEKLINNSHYATWRGSPMGLAGRDPIFFAQLASELETFHPKVSAQVQDTCLGCHGVLGQRQFAIDHQAATGTCGAFSRSMVDAVPYPPDNPASPLANYGALARDGVSCTSCHRLVLGEQAAKLQMEPQNACANERQQALNPGLTGFAKTFSGSFLSGPPDKLFGPFQDPKTMPMKNTLGSVPEHNANIQKSELCGSCHTIHLPVLSQGRTIGHGYEQTTYPEWAFSDYREGETADGALPLGAGAQAQSCQSCHMRSKDDAGNPYRSKIAAIQEHSNFPQAEQTLLAEEIDLPVRSGVSKHNLVGLNLFLLKMAEQFPDVFGIRLSDPMLGARGVEPIRTAEAAMLEQASSRTASVTVDNIQRDGETLSARVRVTNKAGHKFPSGVAFRRAFLEFSVLDAEDKVLWSSGRTNGSGVLIDDKGEPIAGELWWKADCSARIAPEARLHQPHYQVITRQDQAQIYEELTSSPGDAEAPHCGPGTRPEGTLTTSFLSICSKVKDNRLLPHGFLKLRDRIKISRALGAGADLAEETSPVGVEDDPDYETGGGDTLLYRVPLPQLSGTPAKVIATLYYQATPPYYLQDRFCTSNSTDTKRLYYIGGNLDLSGTAAQDWKLRVVSSGRVRLP